MPHRMDGQHIQFLWKAPSMQAWENAFRKGETNRDQSRFFSPKVQEELFDIVEDPHCIRNLALDPANAPRVLEYRKIVTDQMISTFDTGVIPEALMMELSEGTTAYSYTHSLGKNYIQILNASMVATAGKREYLSQLQAMLVNDHPAIRYWGATGCVILREGGMELKDALIRLLDDEYVTVRIAAAEALYELGEINAVMETLKNILTTQHQSLLVKEKEIDGYAPEVFELTHALNVITYFNDRGFRLKEEIKAIAQKEKPDYSKRAAEYLLQFYDH